MPRLPRKMKVDVDAQAWHFLVMFSGFRVSQMVLICKATSGFSHSAVLRLPAVKTIFWFITPNL